MDEYVSLERIADAAELRALLQVADSQDPNAGGLEAVREAIGVLVRRILLRALRSGEAPGVAVVLEVERAALG